MFKNSVSYKGSARVLLRNLELDQMRYIDKTKVTKLMKSFEAAGCHHDDLGDSSLPVLIDFEKSQELLVAAGFSKSTDLSKSNSLPLDLSERVKFMLLYGDHRVLAAQEHLPAMDRWWTVHVFDSGISIEDRARVMQNNRQASQAPNGRDLAAMLNVRDRALLDSWRLEKQQKSTFKRLRNADEQYLHGIVGNLLRYRGLQEGAGGNWAPILEMHCFEEVYAYLSAVERTWKYILGTDIRPDQLDESTVVALQMQIPDSSTDDCDAIRKLFENNKVFPLVEDQNRRKRLSERVLNCKRILSFQSFFDDFRYIRPCFESLSILLPGKSWRQDKSFQQVFKHNWNGKPQHDDRKHDFLRCYIELWLFAMREFPSLSSSKTSLPLQDKASTNKLIRPQLAVPKKEVELAYNASLLGFVTCEIERFKSMHPNGIQQVGPNRLPPEYSCDNDPLPRTARSNRPSESDYLQDRNYLHPIYMLHAHPARKKRYATRIAVTKDIVQCCWSDTERWAAPPRRSQNRRFPISISTNEVAGHVGGGPKVAKPPTTKPPQRGSFDMVSFQRSLYAKSYQKLITNPEDTSVPTKMEFSDAFVKAQGMEKRINTLQTTKHEETRADQDFDHVAKALQLLENSSSGSGEATGASLGARNVLDKEDGCDDPMDMDLPKESQASQGYDDEIKIVHDSSLRVKPLNVAMRQQLGGTDDNPGDRTFLSPLRDGTTRASSMYSLYDDTTDENSQDATQVWADDGNSNVQAPYQDLQGSQQDIDELREQVLPHHPERIPENAVQTSSQRETSASHSKSVEGSSPEPASATESSSRLAKAPSSLHYSVQEGEEAELQVTREAELHEDPIQDDPSGGRGSHQTLEPHEGPSSPHNEAGELENSLQSGIRRAPIPDDDQSQKTPHGHDTTIEDVDQHHSKDDPVPIDSGGESKTSADPTKGRISEHEPDSQIQTVVKTVIKKDGLMPPLMETNRKRVTQVPLDNTGTEPLDLDNKDGERRHATILGKRKWVGEQFKSKGRRMNGNTSPAKTPQPNARVD